MSWFQYGDSLTSRGVRKGVWLRVRTLPEPLLAEAKKFMRMSDSIQWVIVDEIQTDNYVLLEFWCQSVLDCIRSISRYNVLHIRVKEDPEWICEGDLGRGYKEPRKKRKKK